MFWKKDKKNTEFKEEKITGLKLDCDDSAREQFYKKVAKARRIDESFALPTDIPLTEDEKKQIDEYWGKYSFAYPEIDYKSFKTFKNRYGKFDVRHCPGAIRTMYLNKFFIVDTYNMAYQNKGLLELFYPCVRMPVVVARRLNNMFFDKDFNFLSFEETINLFLEKAHSGTQVIVKPSAIGGGRGIFFVDENSTYESVKRDIESIGPNAFVAQEVLEQGAFMSQFNPDAVNTIRVMSMIFKSQVHILAIMIRVGKPGNKVDNYSQGGSIFNVDTKTGECGKTALNYDRKRVEVLPSGFDLSNKDLVVPNFDKVITAVKQMHARNPYTGLIAWDIALDKEEMPVLIEANHAGMTQVHEALSGPLFGDLTDELLDYYLIKRFSIPFRVGDWSCEEFSDHVAIIRYNGNDKKVVIPNEIKGKKVTFVGSKAFKGKEVSGIMSTEDVISILPRSIKIDIAYEIIKE